MNLQKAPVFYLYLILQGFWGCTSSSQHQEEFCKSEQSIQFFPKAENLEIIAQQDFGGTIRSSFIFQDTLIYLLADKPKHEIKILDLKNRQFIGGVPLDPNFFDFPSGIQVISKDSILVSDFHFPMIRLINSLGEVLDTYNLYKENLWEMPKEGFANFGLYGGFGIDFQYIPERNSFLVPLRQLDQWYFVKEKKNFPAIGEFSLETRDFSKVFGKYEGLYVSEENLLLPFYLSHPIVERVGDRIILSFSMDPNLYIYSLEGEFIEKKCGSIPEFELGEPLRYDMNDYDSDGIMNFNKGNSYFGEFFYIKDAERFVRVYWKCVKGKEGECKSKQAFALIFDRNVNLVEVRKTNEIFEGDAYSYQVPYQNGFLSKLAIRESDDQFILGLFYQLDK